MVLMLLESWRKLTFLGADVRQKSSYDLISMGFYKHFNLIDHNNWNRLSNPKYSRCVL